MCVNLRNIIILHCPFASSFWLIALKAFGWSLTFSSNVFAILHLFWWANRFCGRRKLLWLAIVQAPFTSFRWKKWSHFQGSLLFLISLWTWFFLLFPIGAKNKHRFGLYTLSKLRCNSVFGVLLPVSFNNEIVSLSKKRC